MEHFIFFFFAFFHKILFLIFFIKMNSRELEYFTSQEIKLLRILGRGAFGVVFQVFSSHYNCEFALKKIPEKAFSTMELECLIEIDSPRKTQIYKYYKFDGSVYLLMEFCPADLSKVLKSKPVIAPDVFMKYVKDVILAVKACHDLNIAHSDIKPSNFLLDNYGRIKITDFGLSTIYKGDPVSFAFSGTRLYMAPEIFARGSYNPIIADIWALGVTIFYMATKDHPFKSQNEEMLAYAICRGKYKDDKIDNPDLRQLIARCLTVDPKQRATVDELLEMPYFQEKEQLLSIPMSKSRLSLFKMQPEKLIVKPKIPEVKSIASLGSAFYRNNSSSRLRLTIPTSKSVAQESFAENNTIEEVN